MGAFPLLDYLTLSSATVGEGLGRLSRTCRWRAMSLPSTLKTGPNAIRIVYTKGSAFGVQFSAALTLRHLRNETEGRLAADYVTFQQTLEDPDEYARCVGCPVRMAGWSGFVLSAAAWRLPMRRGYRCCVRCSKRRRRRWRTGSPVRGAARPTTCGGHSQGASRTVMRRSPPWRRIRDDAAHLATSSRRRRLVVSGAGRGHASPGRRALPRRPLTLDWRGELPARLLRSGRVPPRVSALVWLAARVPCVVGRPGRGRLDERHRGPPCGPGDPPRSVARGRRHDGHREVRRQSPGQISNLGSMAESTGREHGHAADESPGRVRPHLDSASCRARRAAAGQTAAIMVSRTALAQAGRPRASTEPQEWLCRPMPVASAAKMIGDDVRLTHGSSPRPGNSGFKRRSPAESRPLRDAGVSDAGVPSALVWPFAWRANTGNPSVFAQHVRASKARSHRLWRPLLPVVSRTPRRGLRSRLDYSASTSCPAFCAFAVATIFACWCDGTSS